MIKTITLYTKPIPLNQKFFVRNGRNILSNKYRDTKTALALETRSQVNFSPLSTTLAINLHFYFGDNRRRDIDAYTKIILDSMEGIMYENDCQITEMHVFKEVDKENPRTVVQIYKS
jgi:Holliday junction resolvase RusA-like endonuclease